LALSQPQTPLLQYQQPLPAPKQISFQQPSRHQDTTFSAGSPSQIPQLSSYGHRSISNSTLASSASNGSFSSNASSSIASPLQQPTASETPDDEATALTGVIIPGLQAALNRRQVQLNKLLRQSVQSTSSSTSSHGYTLDANEVRRRQLQGQENIRRLVGKVSRLFKEIDKWDAWAPIGMADVDDSFLGGTFLEGVLEEMLSRVEEEEEAEMGVH
jgi:serine/threonine-protein kinase 24/25/MST4